jgi:hypothetical protein
VILAVGDVAGKGSPAALLMALLLAMLRTLVDEGLDPEPLITRLNTQICRHSPGSRFITIFYAIYDPATGNLTYVNAGQNPPLIRRGPGNYERLGATGIALGMFDQSAYSARRDAHQSGRDAGALQRRHHRGGESRRSAARGSRVAGDPGQLPGRGRRRSSASTSSKASSGMRRRPGSPTISRS